MEIKKRKLNLNGYIPDKEDKRDFLFKASIKIKDLPESTDLRPKMSPIEDQKTIGSCVPHGIIGALEYYENVMGIPFEDLSRLFLYYTTRKLQGDTRHDTGCEIRLCLKALSKSGCCNENLWKYDVRRYRTNPPQKCYDDAVRYKNVSYYRISSLYDVISALAEGNPVIFGATLFSSFYDADENGIVPVPKKTDYEIGRHCMLISGHFENSNQFIVRNSWGSGWAGIMKGYCLMPYEYIGDKSLVSDLWVLNFRG